MNYKIEDTTRYWISSSCSSQYFQEFQHSKELNACTVTKSLFFLANFDIQLRVSCRFASVKANLIIGLHIKGQVIEYCSRPSLAGVK